MWERCRAIRAWEMYLGVVVGVRALWGIVAAVVLGIGACQGTDFSRYLLDGAFACYTTIPKTYSLVTHSH